MKVLSVFLMLMCLTACASGNPKSIEERYTENLKVIQTCMFNAIVGVLSYPQYGSERLNQVCEEKEYKYSER